MVVSKKQKLMGLREYARYRGCALSAVQKAIRSKRISVILIKGKKKIDPKVADVEWKNNTLPQINSHHLCDEEYFDSDSDFDLDFDFDPEELKFTKEELEAASEGFDELLAEAQKGFYDEY